MMIIRMTSLEFIEFDNIHMYAYKKYENENEIAFSKEKMKLMLTGVDVMNSQFLRSSSNNV